MGSGDKEEFNEIKSKGNVAYNCSQWTEALKWYQESLRYASSDSDKATIFKNMAAVYLKLRDYENASVQATSALNIHNNDPKALYRRAEAMEHLERYEEALKDARHVLLIEPGHKEIQKLLQRLNEKVQNYMKQKSNTAHKIKEAFAYAFDSSKEMEKRETAMNNMIVLAKDENSCSALIEAGIIDKLQDMFKTEKKKELCLTGLRVISELCKKLDTTKKLISELGIPWVFDLMNDKNESWVSAGQYCFQTVLNTLSGLKNNQDSAPDEKLCEENKKEIDTMLTCLVYASNARTLSGLTRDAILQLIARNVHYRAINWAFRLIEIKGLQRLLEIASEIPEYKYESSMETTDSTRTLVSVCLSRIYENMYHDRARKDFVDNITEFVNEKLRSPDIESKVQATAAVTVLLQGPLDVGNSIIAREGILDMILVMADSDDVTQQKVAIECIIAAASKEDKAKIIVAKGMETLSKLVNNRSIEIQVRSIVALCKVGSCGGTDATARPFGEGGNTKVAQSCMDMLTSSSDKYVKKWAAEGLSYLTLDAEVKELLVDNLEAIHALIEVAETKDMSAVYGIVTILINLCNAYEKKEVVPEMVELAKFAKHHIPEEHELDNPEKVTRRITILGNAGITSALVSLANTESHNCKELISRVLNKICCEQHLRGTVVQQGGVKILLKLSKESTAEGMKQAAQALARIGITMNPEIAFPGEKSKEIVKPLLMLLLPECDALKNFESLMALCNLASMGEDMIKYIIKEGGFSKIIHYVYIDHAMVRRAATQCVTNFVLSPLIVSEFERQPEMYKLIILLNEDEDVETAQAAAGAVAMLTASSKVCCERIFDLCSWEEVFKTVLSHPDPGVQLRGLSTMYHVMDASENNAKKIIETDLMELLMALSILDDESRKQVVEYAKKCLNYAEKLGFIRKTDDLPKFNPDPN